MSESEGSQHYVDVCNYECPRCGKYRLSDYIKDEQRFDAAKHLISAWIRRQQKLGLYNPLVRQSDDNSDWFDNLQRAGFPQGVNEKLDAILLAYADIDKDEYAKIVIPLPTFRDCSKRYE